jgi:hypothetical protein
LLILLGLVKTGFLPRLSQALDFTGFAGGHARSIPKVIHKEEHCGQSVLESMTYPAFRDSSLSMEPKLAR